MKSDSLYSKLLNEKFIIAGPCVIENELMLMRLAENIKKIGDKHNIRVVFKASFDKANRTSLNSYRGPGLSQGLKMLEMVKKNFDLYVTTDIHESYQAKYCEEFIDIIQIPAFLCRQTDLLVSAAETNRIVNIKKAQFLDGKDMKYPLEKVLSSGNSKVMLTERGTLFGLGNLIVDFRQMIDMKEFGIPIIMDVTHSTQKPGSEGGKSGGDRKYAHYYAKLANAIDINGFFFEVHENPDAALSDGPNMITPEILDRILSSIED